MKYPKFWIYIIAAIVAAMIFCCLCSCNGTTKTRTTENINGTTFDVIEVDSCEYLITTFSYQGYMAHKGNCKYCEQRRYQRQCVETTANYQPPR